MAVITSTHLSYSVLYTLLSRTDQITIPFPHTCRRLLVTEKYVDNCRFTQRSMSLLFLTTFALLAFILLQLILSGDIHPNPGPNPLRRQSSSSSTTSTFESLDLSKHISFVHYNVQSIVLKLDVLYAELCDFDILAFTETWLNPSIAQSDILLNSYQSPERKDRHGDSHGGVMLYVKDTLHYKRRSDLEILGVECIWIELVLSTKRILFGVYYRPPNTDSLQHSRVVDSIHLAVDTGIDNIIITGDFNINMSNPNLARKIHSVCQMFSFTQCITEQTHFTETSSSLIDIILSSKDSLILSSGVSDPFLQQNIRYHCPVYGILNLKTRKSKSFKKTCVAF